MKTEKFLNDEVNFWKHLSRKPFSIQNYHKGTTKQTNKQKKKSMEPKLNVQTPA